MKLLYMLTLINNILKKRNILSIPYTFEFINLHEEKVFLKFLVALCKIGVVSKRTTKNNEDRRGKH